MSDSGDNKEIIVIPDKVENPEKTSEKPAGILRDDKGRLLPNQPSLNPNGRPKGRKNFATLFDEAIKVIANSKGMTMEQIEVDLVKRGVLEALNGDFYFWEALNNRLFGKPATKISFDDDVSALEINIVRNKKTNESSS